jgi:hypothetical protein
LRQTETRTIGSALRATSALMRMMRGMQHQHSNICVYEWHRSCVTLNHPVMS